MSNRSTPPHKTHVAVLGAAFDPIHFGHCAMAALVLHENAADSVWLCPSPARWDKTPVASPQKRLQWAEMAARHLQQQGLSVEACSLELKQTEFRGSLYFLRQLSHKYPSTLFSLLVGQDALSAILQWRDPTIPQVNGAQLLAEYPILVATRAASGTHYEASVPSAQSLLEAISQDLKKQNLRFCAPPVILPQFTDLSRPLLAGLQDNATLASYSSSKIKKHAQQTQRTLESAKSLPIYSDIWSDILQTANY